MDEGTGRGTPCAGLRIGDVAPDFSARSTAGDVRLSDYRGQWVVFFSHPADFTPVCTTEFAALAKAAEEFEKRGCALLGLSVDSLFSHFAWLRLIRDRMGVEVRFPVIEDPTFAIARAFGMVGQDDSDTATVRNTFFIDPSGTIQSMNCYPANVGRSVPEMLRTLDALQAVQDGGLAPVNWSLGDPLFTSPYPDLKSVFGASNELEWFLSEDTNAK